MKGNEVTVIEPQRFTVRITFMYFTIGLQIKHQTEFV